MAEMVSTLANVQPAVKFDAAFIERRMREHQEFREHLSCVLAAAIIDEILADAEEGRWTVL